MSASSAVPEAAALAESIEEFLRAHPHAAVLEDGRVLFDLRAASCSISADHGRCLLHLWSSERNLVRTITGVAARRDTLRLEVRRLGQSRPQTLTLAPDPDFRTPTARDTARRRYLRSLEQALARHFPEWTPQSFRSAMDMEHSFGPAYARGLLVRGQSSFAVIGAGPEEQPATVDGVLTLGILWLAWCRDHGGGRRVIQGLKVIVPAGAAGLTRARMALLDNRVAQWELYQLDAKTGELAACAIDDDGNQDVQLLHAFDPKAALERCGTALEHLRSILPEGLRAATEVRVRSATEIALALHGLEYARIRHGLAAGSFARRDEITFGAGGNETLLDESTEALFLELMERLFQSRHPAGTAADPLYRLQPERWLESVLRRDLSALDAGLGAAPICSQVPALCGGSEMLLDLLTADRRGRLAVIEVKADDDLHLPLQALDYWTRVRQLHRAGEFVRRGYFQGLELSSDDPLLYLVAPSLHIHPANETVLRHFSPAVPWELVGLDEHWRENLRVVLRKTAGAAGNAALAGAGVQN